MKLKVLVAVLFSVVFAGSLAFAHGDVSTHEHPHQILILAENIDIDQLVSDESVAVNDDVDVSVKEVLKAEAEEEVTEAIVKDLIKEAADEAVEAEKKD